MRFLGAMGLWNGIKPCTLEVKQTMGISESWIRLGVGHPSSQRGFLKRFHVYNKCILIQQFIMTHKKISLNANRGFSHLI